MTSAIRVTPKAAPARGSTARALMLATALVLAVIGGAALSGAGTGAVQDVMRVAGFGRSADVGTQIEEQQRQQSAVIAELERLVFTVSGEVAALSARVDDATRPMAAMRDQFAKLDNDVGSLKGQMIALRFDNAKASAAGRGPSADLDAALKGARADIDAMRTSIDERDQLDFKVYAAIGKRLSRLENAVAPGEVTGSTRKRPAKRHTARGRDITGSLPNQGPGRPGMDWIEPPLAPAP
jgi:hypothetical protein